MFLDSEWRLYDTKILGKRKNAYHNNFANQMEPPRPMDHAPPNQTVEALLSRLRPSATSLIVSVFGDSILPRGGTVWLGSLINLMAPFGLNDRAVRTAVFRLTKEGWLNPTQVGRRSFYALTDSARLRFQAAQRAIYAAEPRPWDGSWTIVLAGLLPPQTRERLRAELFWQGFGQVLPGVLVHPAPDALALRETLDDAGVSDTTPVLTAAGSAWANGLSIREMASRAWDLSGMAARYEAFVGNFDAVLPPADEPSAETCFVLRSLLIHEYRRALLRDPLLPDALLPAGWPGSRARDICRDLYCGLHRGTEQYLRDNLEPAEGSILEADETYYARFGGLT